jgi:hypothetical protein
MAICLTNHRPIAGGFVKFAAPWSETETVDDRSGAFSQKIAALGPVLGGRR